MLCAIGSAFVGYLAAAGLATNAAVVGRGLVASARLASQGQYREAGLLALAAVAAPAVMVQVATTEMVLDVIDAARELSGKPLAVAELAPHAEEAA
jgi:hypothetical protein